MTIEDGHFLSGHWVDYYLVFIATHDDQGAAADQLRKAERHLPEVINPALVTTSNPIDPLALVCQ